MICCKIVTDYNNPNGKFNSLLKSLANYGDFLWIDNNLFFSNTDDVTCTRKRVTKTLLKFGFNHFFIDEYNKDRQPHESDYINGWVLDKMIKINYTQCENASQEVFHNISRGLDMLDHEIAQLQIVHDNMKQEAESNG